MVINNKKLQEGFKIIKPFVEANNSISLFSNIKVSIEDGNILTLKAMTTQYSIMVEAEVEQSEGEFLITKNDTDLIKSDEIEVAEEFIKAGAFKIKHSKSNLDEFKQALPVFDFENGYAVVVEEKAMKLIYNSIDFSKDSYRFIKGFHVLGNGTIFSTNGKALALYDSGIVKEGDENFTAIVNGDLISKVKGKSLVTIKNNNSMVEYYDGKFLVTIQGKNLEGSTPPYNKVIPNNLVNFLTLKKSCWDKHFTQFSKILGKDNKRVTLSDRVFVENIGRGIIYDEKMEPAFPITIAINAELLNDFFIMIGDAEVGLSEENYNSIMLTNAKVKYIVMPMKI